RLAGRLTRIDNRKLARLAKLAGAPERPAAGITLHKRLGDWLNRDEPIATIHAEAPGELAYARDYALSYTDMFTIESSPE
ncbi:MAG TPA: thymidine phosphorylase, partial [Hyphomonas sp.]|nr:thymidine phosphorylase [Hyphomonas sp.]